ncbi:TetR/AcrR family transcriptional regulator [Paractinoplanes atraurantiacus]|uniref:DNA-binding transcriptional regulator, AcrR family n=1 Tax=Paractinoplanes atraurantiacus TaxID=1036182 RepID=A0A285ILF4_9ACTN|nr:TetR family transcriptional regulator [Actinoplanes atraurantiacus]SNY48809.1 DNA-binding transcriptional regulator, AcrR family [Actinoplanes atraurantiacus]
MGLRERKKQATRTALSWAAIRLIVERGYDGVLVEDIATEAGVSARTFNNYFSSKAEAVASRHLDRCLQVAEALRDRPAGEPLWEAITQAVLAQFEQTAQVTAAPLPRDTQAWAAGLRLMTAVPAIKAETLRASADAETALAAAVAARTGTDPEADLYPKLVAAAVMAANTVTFKHFVGIGGRPAELRAMLIGALDQLAAGLPEPPR